MRGKGLCLHPQPVEVGITPAYAGKSLTIPKLTTRSWDYPRVCGEKAAFTFDFPKEMGLPPRMRGKAVSNSRLKHPDRITPACAGKSGWRSCCPGCNRDHPRVCGEKLMNRVKHIDPHRITPAYAGKSWSAHSLVSSLKDHPRVCGEKFGKWSTKGRITGLPPRMRGKVDVLPEVDALIGITPACAGKRL